MLAFADILRALEHHVLEEMREARMPRLLVPRAHIKRHAQRHGRRRVIFREHYAQTVLQRELLNGNLHAPGRRRVGRSLSRLCSSRCPRDCNPER